MHKLNYIKLEMATQQVTNDTRNIIRMLQKIDATLDQMPLKLVGRCTCDTSASSLICEKCRS